MKRTRPILTSTASAILLMGLLSGCAAGADANPPLDVTQLEADASDFQKEILDDGVVTPAEYEKALLAQRECVISAGATAKELRDTGNNEQTFDYEVSAATMEEVDRINAEADKCISEYIAQVGQLWAYQQLLSPEEREDARPDVVKCLIVGGVHLDADATTEDIFKAVSAEENRTASEECVEEFTAFFSAAPTSDGHDH